MDILGLKRGRKRRSEWFAYRSYVIIIIIIIIIISKSIVNIVHIEHFSKVSVCIQRYQTNSSAIHT